MGLLRYSHLLAFLTGGAALIPAAASAQIPTGYISIEIGPSEDRPDLLRIASAIGDGKNWAINDDYPFEARAAAEVGRAYIRASIDTQGQVSDCIGLEGSTSARFVEAACRLVQRRGRFRHALSSAGEPTPSYVDVDVYFSFSPGDRLAPMPPPPTTPPYRGSTLRLVSKPNWPTRPPSGKSDGEAVLAMSIDAATPGSPERRFCKVYESSGDAALDQATCEAAKMARYEPTDAGPSPYFGRWIDMLVRWDRRKARHRLPIRSAPLNAAIEGGYEALRAEVRPSPQAEPGDVLVTLGIDGQITCRITETLGSDAIDRATCASLRSKIRFTPGEDIFGRKVPNTFSVRY
ncbi:energy transducer TonB [Sphingomonas sp. HF-S3]|uniref:Energy transducer TonB n=1 Tax=Sphingomonas rustica TaxID=3103142 RepID=A0ABV0BAZ4_9SPHN